MNENYEKENSKIELKTQQDAQKVLELLSEKKSQIIDDSPRLSLSIKDAPHCLDALFEKDGTPKGNFMVTDRFKKKIELAFNHPHHVSSTNDSYYGKPYYDNEYLIQATPTFLTDEELEYLQFHGRLNKQINNSEIEFVPPILQKDDYSFRVERYRERIREPRKKVQELEDIIHDIKSLKTKLLMGEYEVIIEQPDQSGISR